MERKTVLIRGAGDLASGTALRLHNSGFNVVMCEVQSPMAVRRTVCFSEAVYDGVKEIEGVRAVLCRNITEIKKSLEQVEIAVIVDEKAKIISSLKPDVVVDAILAKKNLGTNLKMAPFTVALGPGFTAGIDVSAVIETKRGHFLGSIILSGTAAENTGIPGIIGGFGRERVVYSVKAGVFTTERKIGESIKKGEPVGFVDGMPLRAEIDGVVRGLLRSGFKVSERFKCADIDPRSDSATYINTVSDKARAVAGGVLESILHYFSFGQSQEKAPESFKGTIAYVDGSFDVLTKRYSYGAVIIADGRISEFSKAFDNQDDSAYHNIAGEVEASKFVMQYCIDHGIGEVSIYYDYLGIQCWCDGSWKTNNDFTRGYRAFYDSIKDRLAVHFVKVKAHSGDKYNERADRLARAALEEQK